MEPRGAPMRKQDLWSQPGVAAEYDRRRFAGPLRARKQRHDEALVRSLLGRAGVRRGSRLLDLPYGTGRMLPCLRAAGQRVVGVDRSLAMMRAGQGAGRDGARLVRASAFALPFAAGSFDAALCLRFLFHLDDRPQRIAVLRELARVTAGPLLLQVRYRLTGKHAGRWLRHGVGAARAYRPSQGRRELVAELEQAGLVLEHLRPVSRLFSDKALLVAQPSMGS